MSRPKGQKHYTRQYLDEKMALILAFLSDGSAPFISLASERAGVNRAAAAQWIRDGEERGEEPRAGFAREVRRIRAEWMAETTRAITQQDGGHAARESAKHQAWLLMRVDRELFDPPKEIAEKQVKDKSDGARIVPPQPGPDSPQVQAAADELAQPEPESQVH